MPESNASKALKLPHAPLYFGAFELCPHRLMLFKNGQAVQIGNRALSVLMALATRPFELVEKADLIAFAWPKSVVEECNLRAQIVALRRVLGDGHGAYVITVPGRGYRLAASVTRKLQTPPAEESLRVTTLPLGSLNIIGRTDQVCLLGQQLLSKRFLTITGSAGIGKTTVAHAVADDVAERFPQGICFLDISSVISPHLIPGMLAAALGITSAIDQPLHSIAASLATSRMLLVLDNCEHLLETVAESVAIILRDTEEICVLATSREPIRAPGESVHRLAPMTLPPAGVRLTAKQALAFSGIQLFVERASAHDPAFLFNDNDVNTVSLICHKLDSNALAIEIAAARVRTFGIHELVVMLDGTFRLQMTGKRTSLERHRTLSTALDWTFSMLSTDEQTMLCQLSIFPVAFTLEAVTAVVDKQTFSLREPLPLLDSLVDKSLLSSLDDERGRCYRLLETTRVYAHEKLTQRGDMNAVAARHARYTLLRLRQAGEQLSTLSVQHWLALYGMETDSVRAALDWAYSWQGNRSLGIELTLLSVPLWLRKPLIGECRVWVDMGLKAGPHAVANSPHQRMLLQTALASVLMLTFGANEEIRTAWMQTLEDAKRLNDVEHQLRALWGLWSYCCCSNQYEQALELARQYDEIVDSQHQHDYQLLAKRMLATALFYRGDLTNARQTVQQALSSDDVPNSHLIDVYFDQRIAAGCLCAQIQLSDGNIEDAWLQVEHNVAQATQLTHPLTLWYTLCLSALPMALMVDNMAKARHFLALLQASTARHDLPFWRLLTRSFESILLIREGDPEAGLPQLGEVIHQIRANGGSPLFSLLQREYAAGLSSVGLHERAGAIIDETIQIASAREEQWFMPQLLTLKAYLVCTES
ncbi:winged helix-turn-helix domain-containing protein, partial [Pseudomonas fluorescens]|uniref:winged helix-turn-helix domain-containing protein n=1 Tax=Pseudomonas fluorescens TaxID=294 RepID=UPI0005FB59F0